jgi:5-formyltetrahydrofolate cyclo-ligase
VNPVNNSKSVLRERMRARLAELPAAELRAHSAAVWERLSVLPAFASANVVMTYVSKESEIETHGLIRQLLALGRQVCVPAFDGRAYRLSQLRDFDELTVGKFGILEPKLGPAMEPDALLVPGLAFDRNGNRLGRGRGVFDALLRPARGVKIALAHDFQVLSEVPAEKPDVRADFIVTESRVVNCKG